MAHEELRAPSGLSKLQQVVEAEFDQVETLVAGLVGTSAERGPYFGGADDASPPHLDIGKLATSVRARDKVATIAESIAASSPSEPQVKVLSEFRERQQMVLAAEGARTRLAAVERIAAAGVALANISLPSDKYEVTERQYQECVETGGCRGIVFDECHTFGLWRDGEMKPQDVPASCITWSNAVAFCRWVGKRLPSEAEWEKAARGTDERLYPWGNQPPNCERAHFADCGPDKGHVPAGLAHVHSSTRPPSPYGAFDMAGNIAEWVEDKYVPYVAETQVDPKNVGQGMGRVVRGGSWLSGSATNHLEELRTYFRQIGGDGVTDGTLGFRCARSVGRSAASRARR